jgi:peptidoglycan-N-acetylglucosamine deacetylase
MNLLLLGQELRAKGGVLNLTKEYSYVSAGIKKKCKIFPHPCILLKMLGLLVGTGLALGYAGYQCVAPRSQLYGKTFAGKRDGRREMALTFDDGPNDPHTFRLLDVLAKHSVKATFFMIGRYVEMRHDIAREVAAQAHVIGNHTFTHPNLVLRTQRQLADELWNCERALNDAVGEKHQRLFRPPWGARRPATLRAIRREGFTPVMWSVTSWDWSAKSSEKIERKVSSQVRGGDVVLLHDGGHLRFGTDRGFTVTATDRLLQRYKSEGFEFVTVPEMMRSESSAAIHV